MPGAACGGSGRERVDVLAQHAADRPADSGGDDGDQAGGRGAEGIAPYQQHDPGQANTPDVVNLRISAAARDKVLQDFDLARNVAALGSIFCGFPRMA